MAISRRAVFLDKDGTLVENVPYNANPELVRLARGAGEALRRVSSLGYELVVVSNQSGVARGYFREEAVERVATRLRELLRCEGVGLRAFYYCPHHPEAVVSEYRARCECRKPSPGLIERGARELGIELAGSWLVGDILDDIEAGNRAGVRTVLLDNGGETEWRTGPWRQPDYTVASLVQAGECIAAAIEQRGTEAFG